MAQRRADLVLGVVVAALGAWALSMALDLSMFNKIHTPGPGLFPTLVSSFLLALGVLLVILCVRDLVAARREPLSPEDANAFSGDVNPLSNDSNPLSDDVDPSSDPLSAAGGTLVDVGPSQPRRIGRAGAVFACYVVTMPLMSILGFVPAAAVLIVLILFGVERRRDWRALAAAVLIPVAAFSLFVHLLTIQLPTGLLDLGPLST